MPCFNHCHCFFILQFNCTIILKKIGIRILVCCESYFIHAVAKEHFFGCLLKFPSFSWPEGLLQRITGWLRLEGTCGSHPVQVPCSGGANQSLLPRTMVRWVSSLDHNLTLFSLNLDSFLRSV